MSTTASEFRAKVIGAWSLISYAVVSKSGRHHYPLTDRAKGIIMYTPDGYMSAQIMAPDIPPLGTSDLHGGSEKEAAEAMRGYLAYSGRFCVKEENGKPVLEHEMEVCLFPNWKGNRQIRVPKLEVDDEGEVLTLSTEKEIMWEGELMLPTLRWRRKIAN